MNTLSDPNLPLIESARVLIDQGQLTEAADVLNKARAQAPNDPRVYLMAGVMSEKAGNVLAPFSSCLLYTSPSPRDKRQSRMPSSA